ncbi:nSTAND1 domain-containing NTPase [Streptomyces geranii]|uniref:nSTAND1 domain-containing NTPase n=1 Tax=Streptomyces geranii TaxID=2058923 RepID=UPI000D040A43|nr:hypothetical protein [Streptomyces geranii]
MGRPERPLDPEAGPVQRFAHELRELRRAAGCPSYRSMAVTAGFSVTTLAHAAGGERLPSLAVVQGYARACGGDPGEWESRWKEAEAEFDRLGREDPEGVEPPYRGLARFETDDHALFFGRDRMIDRLRRLVCDRRLAVLFGPSGSGKSSLLRAGLIPRLREEMGQRDCPSALRVLTPGTRPATTYGHLLAPAPGEPESWVVVDQFEEIFTLCRDPRERSRFIDLLLTAREPDSRLRVLITVRADFYARCAEHRGLADALDGAGLLLGPMTADELRDAIVKPAQSVGHLVERELTARLIDDLLHEPGGLPMLSHVLQETWRRRKARTLTLDAYEAAGGVRGAIAASAEEAYGRLSPAQARTARRLLTRMVEPGQGTRDTRRPLTRADLNEFADPEAPNVVERLARARLLAVDEDGVQLAHEALITGWPRLHGWIEEDRERLRHHRRLTEAAHNWLEHDRDPGDLYRGSRLARAEEHFPSFRSDPALTAAERTFLVAAVEAREAEHAARIRSRRRRRMLVGALSAVLAAALMVALVAVRQRTENTARRIAAVADGLRTTDPRAALLLGAAAWNIAPLPETRRALLGSVVQTELDTFTDPAPGYATQRFLVDSGRGLLTVDDDVWQRWDVATHRRTGRGPLPQGAVLAVGRDGRVLAISQETGGVRLWDTTTGRWTGAGPDPVLPEVAIGASGRTYLEGADGENHVRVRSVADNRLLFETHRADRANVAPSPDDSLVAVCPSGHAPQVWDIVRHRRLPGAWDRGGRICGDRSALGFGTGTRFATVSGNGVDVWDTRSRRQVAEVRATGARYVSLSADGRFLATADAGEVQVWRLSDPGTPVFRHSLNNQHLYDCLAWDPEHAFLRYLEGGTVHTLDLSAATTSAWRASPLAGGRLSPDGRVLVTAARTGSSYRFELRDTRDGRLLRTLPSPPVPVSRDPAHPVVPQRTKPLTNFSPDGKTLAYGISTPGYSATSLRVTIWDMTGGGHERASLDLSRSEAGAAVTALALSADGHALYATRTPTIGGLSTEAWNLTTGRRLHTTTDTRLASVHMAVSPRGGLVVGDNRVGRVVDGHVAAQDLVQGDAVSALAFSPDGNSLAAGDSTGRVALWDGDLRHRAGVLRNLFPAPLGETPEAVRSLALSPDGHTLAVGGDAGALQLWDTATQQPLGGPLPTPGEGIDTLAFSTDNRTLYAGGPHVPLQRYAVDTGRSVSQVCTRAGGKDLTEAQWRAYVPEVGYRKVCT